MDRLFAQKLDEILQDEHQACADDVEATVEPAEKTEDCPFGQYQTPPPEPEHAYNIRWDIKTQVMALQP